MLHVKTSVNGGITIIYAWHKNYPRRFLFGTFWNKTPTFFGMPAVAQGNFLWHSLPVASQRLDSSDQFWIPGNQTTWGLSSWSVILKIKCIPKDLRTSNMTIFLGPFSTRILSHSHLWPFSPFPCPTSVNFLCFYSESQPWPCGRKSSDCTLFVLFWSFFELPLFFCPRFMPRIYRPMVLTSGAVFSRCFLPQRTQQTIEVMSELALAMRLNVELCDASERVEKLNYRWRWGFFFVKQKGGGGFSRFMGNI